MRKLILLIFYMVIFSLNFVCAEEVKTLSAGITVEDVPKVLYGSWRISAKLDDTNSYKTFKPQSIDFWELSRAGDVIILKNPFTGASAEISIRTVEGNLIIFSKRTPYDNKELTDTVSIRLNKDTFEGINTLTLQSFSLVDGHVIKTENARYLIKGEKIAGENIIE